MTMGRWMSSPRCKMSKLRFCCLFVCYTKYNNFTISVHVSTHVNASSKDAYRDTNDCNDTFYDFFEEGI